MIVDRFEPVNLSELIPELRLEMEPSLQALDRLLSPLAEHQLPCSSSAAAA